MAFDLRHLSISSKPSKFIDNLHKQKFSCNLAKKKSAENFTHPFKGKD